MQRRIKMEAKYFANQRLRAAGELSDSDTTAPTVTSADEAAVRKTREGWFIALREIEKQFHIVEKALEEYSQKLPIAYMADSIFGLGVKSIGSIVADAGDLSNYRSPAALWKRLGVGRVQQADGTWVNQRKVRGRTKVDKELAIAMGYSPTRHARLYVISSNLVKVSATTQTNASLAYRQLYDERRAHEINQLAVKGMRLLPGNKITKVNAETSMSHQQLHRRCLRYVVKRLVKNMWIAWRAAMAESQSQPPVVKLAEAAD